jgi:hypothetical protein
MRFAPGDAKYSSVPAAIDPVAIDADTIDAGTIDKKLGKQYKDGDRNDRYGYSMRWEKLWCSLLIGAMSFNIHPMAHARAVSQVAPLASEPSLNQPRPLQLAQQFQPPNPGTLPGRREGGGTRGGSGFADGTPPIALMPESNLGLTSTEQTLLYFYLPPEVVGLEAELYMFNEAQPEEGSRIITLPQEPGILGVPIPDNFSPLSVGAIYRWYFAIRVDPIDRSGDFILSGFVQRVVSDPSLQHQLSTLPIEHHASVYGEQGLWFDAINLLASMRSQYPNSAQWETQWETLLQSVDLERIATQPLLDVSPATQVSTTMPTQIPVTSADSNF